MTWSNLNNVSETDVTSCYLSSKRVTFGFFTIRERWVRSIKDECLSKLILFGENSLRRVVSQYLEHYHQERNHQGKDNLLLFPAPVPCQPDRRSAIRCRQRLGALLNYYSPAA
jgi:hypothetical protein